MTLMVFAVGGLAFWMPSYFQEVRKMSAEEAGLYFGGISVVAGILGTLGGQLIGDSWEKRAPGGGYLRLSGLGLLAAAPFALATPFIGSLPLCLLFVFIAELLIFLNTGPLNTALVNAAPPGVRELAVGLNVLMIHLLGDAISPPLLGALADSLKRHGHSPDMAASVAVAATALPLSGGDGSCCGGRKVVSVTRKGARVDENCHPVPCLGAPILRGPRTCVWHGTC